MKFIYERSVKLDKESILSTAQTLSPYIEHLQNVAESDDYSFDESSINLPYDTTLYEDVLNLVEAKVTEGLEYVFVLGIGGSNLGTKAIYDAMFGYFDNLLPGRLPKMVFVDTNDPLLLEDAQNLLKSLIDNPQTFVINAVTKSGSTTETIVNLEGLAQVIPFEVLKDRLVITTGKNSKLWDHAKDNGIDTLVIPDAVGGRYSVLSPVGLFPLAAVGVDIRMLLDGAQIERGRCISTSLEENPAALSASILYLQHQNGKIISENFWFHPELESLGKWYKQLMGESIGKEKDLDGNTVHAGITPIVTVGSVDLHSVAQLNLGGPKDKMTTFISTEHERESNVTLGRNLTFPDIVPEIENKSAAEIMWAILEGVKIAYRNHGLPFMEVQLEEITPHEIGHFLQFKMIEMMYLAQLMNVNAFDQPNVESYKLETKRILKG